MLDDGYYILHYIILFLNYMVHTGALPADIKVYNIHSGLAIVACIIN